VEGGTSLALGIDIGVFNPRQTEEGRGAIPPLKKKKK